MASNEKKIYLAGPEVFLSDAVEIGRAKKELCATRGLRGLFPFDNEISDASAGDIDQIIYRANVDMIQESDFGIFNLTPFRGPSADVGTVFELGMMTALGKPCFGYTNAPGSLLDRVKAFDSGTRLTGKTWSDSKGMSVEDFGNVDNLMIDASLKEGRTPLYRGMAASENTRFRDLTNFAACLDAIESYLAEEANLFRARA